MVDYISPDAAEDMPDLVGMRVTSIQGEDVRALALEEVLGGPSSLILDCPPSLHVCR